MIDKTLKTSGILDITNSRGRVIFTVCHDVLSQSWDLYYDTGTGYNFKKVSDTFLTAACVLTDSPSGIVSGTFKEEFEKYLKTLSWFKK